MNRFNQSTWSKVQCEMILAFLSFADYFRPKYFLLENVRNFVSFNKGQTFRLTLASLLEMGYQVGIASLLIMELQLFSYLSACIYNVQNFKSLVHCLVMQVFVLNCKDIFIGACGHVCEKRIYKCDC